MQKIYFSILITGILFILAVPVKAQIQFHIGINLNSQPAWGPVGYDNVQYYYLPDIDVYYSVPQHRYYYQSGGIWRSSAYLPHKYGNYNLYNGHKVVMNEDRPYLHDRYNSEKYGYFKNRHDQQPIRDSRDSKYFENKNHPQHNNWVKQQRHDNGHGNSNEKHNKQDNHGNNGNHGDHGK